MEKSRIKVQLSGLAGLIAIALVVAVLIGMYQKVFTPVTTIKVSAPRAGLQLDPGSSVRAFGVPVGEVRDVSVDGPDGVIIEVALNKDSVDRIPADVTASIRATTLFGAKFVQLDVPRGAVAEPIEAGAVVQSTDTTIEANDVFAHAMSLLDAVDVGKLNTTLTSAADALSGNGEKLGTLITDADALLTDFNPEIDTLMADLGLTADVAGNLNDVAPQALQAVGQLNTTTDLFNSSQEDFRRLLSEIPTAADKVGGLINAIDRPLHKLNANLLPVSNLLLEYSPALPCTLQGLIDHVNILGEALGRYEPRADAQASFLPGIDPYTTAENLPKLVTGVGPKCYEQGSESLIHPPHIQFDDGTYYAYDSSPGAANLDTSPITLYQDTVRSFLGTSGANKLLSLIPVSQGGTFGSNAGFSSNDLGVGQ